MNSFVRVWKLAPGTFSLMFVNIAIFVMVAVVLPGFPLKDFFVLSSANYWDNPLTVGAILGYSFMHANVIHLVVNMVSLFSFLLLEKEIGTRRYLTVYMVSAFIGGVVFLILSGPGQAVVGASGAIFGLLGCYIIFNIRKNLSEIIFILGLNIGISFLPNVSWQAHFGGLIVGIIFGIIFKRKLSLKEGDQAQEVRS